MGNSSYSIITFTIPIDESILENEDNPVTGILEKIM